MNKTKFIILLCLAMSNRACVPDAANQEITNGNFTISEAEVREILSDRPGLLRQGFKVVNRVYINRRDGYRIEVLVMRNDDTGEEYASPIIRLDGYDPNNPTHRDQLEEFLVAFKEAEENRESYNKFCGLIALGAPELTLETLRQAGITDIQLVMFSLFDPAKRALQLRQSPMLKSTYEALDQLIPIFEGILGRKGMLESYSILDDVISKGRGDYFILLTRNDWNAMKSADDRLLTFIKLLDNGFPYARQIIDDHYRWFVSKKDVKLLHRVINQGSIDFAKEVINAHTHEFFQQRRWDGILQRFIGYGSHDYVAKLLSNVEPEMITPEEYVLPEILIELVDTGRPDSIAAVMELVRRCHSKFVYRGEMSLLIKRLIELDEHPFVKEIILSTNRGRVALINELIRDEQTYLLLNFAVDLLKELVRRCHSQPMDDPEMPFLIERLIELGEYPFVEEIISSMDTNSRIALIDELIARGQKTYLLYFIIDLLKDNFTACTEIMTRRNSWILRFVVEDNPDLAEKIVEELKKANREVWVWATTEVLNGMIEDGYADLVKGVIDSNIDGFVGSNYYADDLLIGLIKKGEFRYVKELIQTKFPLLAKRDRIDEVLDAFGEEHADFVADIKKAMEELSHPAQAEQFAVDV